MNSSLSVAHQQQQQQLQEWSPSQQQQLQPQQINTSSHLYGARGEKLMIGDQYQASDHQQQNSPPSRHATAFQQQDFSSHQPNFYATSFLGGGDDGEQVAALASPSIKLDRQVYDHALPRMGLHSRPVPEQQPSSGAVSSRSHSHSQPQDSGDRELPPLARRVKAEAVQEPEMELEPEVEHEDEQEEQGSESDADHQSDQQQQQQPDGMAPGGRERRQFEVKEAGRSFSQNDEDAIERDRFGNPVRAYRRHLINGKPVSPAADGADFDRVVDEIEDGQEDDQSAQDYDDAPTTTVTNEQAQQQQPEGSESRRVDAISDGSRPVRNEKRRGPNEQTNMAGGRGEKPQPTLGDFEEIDEHSDDNLLPPNAKDSHKHRLKESLKAQQWDDEPVQGQTSGSSNTDESPKPSSIEAASAEADSDGKKSDIPFKDLDLFSDGRFPFLDNDQEPSAFEEDQRRRAKRSLNELTGRSVSIERKLDHDDIPVNEGQNQLQPFDNKRINEKLASSRPFVREEKEKMSYHENVPLATTKNQQQYSSGRSPSLSDENGQKTRSELNAINWAQKRISSPGSGGVAAQMNDIVEGQEDLSIEVLADPPTQQQPDNVNSIVVNQAQQSNSSNIMGPAFLWPSNGHSRGPQTTPTTSTTYSNNDVPGGPMTSFTAGASGAPQVGHHDAAGGRQVASGSKPKGKKRKKTENKQVKKSKSQNSKYHAAKAASMKRKSKLKKGGLAKKKAKQGKKYAKSYKEFRGATRGKKGARGAGQRGAKKGALYYKDKGYKKKGFKKAYQKLESGDHKTYFDEFRDKDHSKKWKDFKDKHHYSHGKNWAANDRKKYKNMDSKELRDKKYGLGKWREKEQSKYRKDYKKGSKSNSMEESKNSKAKKHHHHR